MEFLLLFTEEFYYLQNLLKNNYTKSAAKDLGKIFSKYENY